LGIDSIKQGISKVLLGRSDGLLFEQDAADYFIRQNKIKNIRRTLYATWKSSIAIRKGPESQKIDRIISRSLRLLKQNGRLDSIVAAIHRPFEDWQPYLADW
jgi:polar amino acid transport system substrate-binding protein